MSKQDEPSELAGSLLRRLLKPDQEPPPQETGSSPGVGLRPTRPGLDRLPDPQPMSPIRPSAPDTGAPQERLTPSVQARPSAQALTPREQMQRAEEALINLRQKMAQVAAEFAQGKINRAQFDAIYGRYSEQRAITERLLARDPESQAWQSVIRPGHTTFLRQHFEAQVISYAIYDLQTFRLIGVTGMIRLENQQLAAVLQRLKQVTAQRGNPGTAQKKINDGRCVLFVPGELTVAVVIFSLEPSAAQVTRIQDIHRDFERANLYALRSGDYAPERLVFPHRALFEDKKR